MATTALAAANVSRGGDSTRGHPKSRAGKRDVPILDETLFRDLGLHVRAHPHRHDLEASLWPGKAPGHNRLTYDREFDPKGLYRYSFKPACNRAGLTGLHFHELRPRSPRWRWSLAR